MISGEDNFNSNMVGNSILLSLDAMSFLPFRA